MPLQPHCCPSLPPSLPPWPQCPCGTTPAHCCPSRPPAPAWLRRPAVPPQPTAAPPRPPACPHGPGVLAVPPPAPTCSASLALPPLLAARGHIPHLSTFHRPWASLSTFHGRHVTHQNSPQSPDPMSPPPGAVTRHLCHRLTPGTTMKRRRGCPGAWPQPLSPHLCPLYPTDSPPGGAGARHGRPSSSAEWMQS